MKTDFLTENPNRLGALRRFAVAITVLAVVGQALLGFEQAIIMHLVGLMTAYAVEIFLEFLQARDDQRSPRYQGGWRNLVDFLLPAHITGLTLSFFLYTGDRIWPVVLASTIAISSKYVFRTRINGVRRHFFNPSNFAILVCLVAFRDIGISAPWMFLAGLDGYWDLAVPAVILVTGTLLNLLFTKRVPLIAAWLAAFVLQGVLRGVVFDQNIFATLLPATGPVAFLFTFYMVSDPGTTPSGLRGQITFGAAVGILYGVLTVLHVVYGLFWALAAVCAVRGVYHAVTSRTKEKGQTSETDQLVTQAAA